MSLITYACFFYNNNGQEYQLFDLFFVHECCTDDAKETAFWRLVSHYLDEFEFDVKLMIADTRFRLPFDFINGKYIKGLEEDTVVAEWNSHELKQKYYKHMKARMICSGCFTLSVEKASQDTLVAFDTPDDVLVRTLTWEEGCAIYDLPTHLNYEHGIKGTIPELFKKIDFLVLDNL